jgi:hypothetical protein
MASVPPTTTTAPPELHEGRDGVRETIKLVNWLRRRMLELIGAPGLTPGATRVSFDLGDFILGDEIAGDSELLLWQRPIPYSFFNASIIILLYLNARCNAGTSLINVRLGGSDDQPDGLIIGTYSVSSTGYPAYTPVQDTLMIARGTGFDFLKLTVITSGEGTIQFKDGGVSLT